MANHILTALVQRKSQLWKELEAIEAFENAMAQNNTDVLTAVPETKPKREVIAVRRKYEKVANPIPKNSEVVLRNLMRKVFDRNGGVEGFRALDNVAKGRKFITVCNRDSELRIADYSNVDKYGRPKQSKLCAVPTDYDVYFARTIMMDIYSKAINKTH